MLALSLTVEEEADHGTGPDHEGGASEAQTTEEDFALQVTTAGQRAADLAAGCRLATPL